MLPLLLGGALAAPLATHSDAPTAAAADPGTLLAGVALAGGLDAGRAHPGGAVTARWWPTRRLLVDASVAQGAAWLPCPGCGGTSGTVAVRGNAIERDSIRLGAWVQAGGGVGGAAWGAAAAGVAVEGGGARVRGDLTMPITTTTDLAELLLVLPEAGLTSRWSQAHATRLAVVGVHLHPVVSHRWSGERAWVRADVRLPPDATAVRVEVGLRR